MPLLTGKLGHVKLVPLSGRKSSEPGQASEKLSINHPDRLRCEAHDTLQPATILKSTLLKKIQGLAFFGRLRTKLKQKQGLEISILPPPGQLQPVPSKASFSPHWNTQSVGLNIRNIPCS